MQLKDYWIPQISKTDEFQWIATSEQPEFGLLSGNVDVFYNEVIAKTATNNGLSRYERMLGLNKAATTEERVDLILLNLNNSLAITEKYLRNLLNNVVGKGFWEMHLQGYEISLKVNSTKEKTFNILRKELRKKIPANIDMGVAVLEDVQISEYIGFYTRSADYISIMMDDLNDDTAIVGRAIVGKAIVGKGE